jgi:hypothetical protein
MNRTSHESRVSAEGIEMSRQRNSLRDTLVMVLFLLHSIEKGQDPVFSSRLNRVRALQSLGLLKMEVEGMGKCVSLQESSSFDLHLVSP